MNTDSYVLLTKDPVRWDQVKETEIVRTVFRLYLEGYSAAKISEHLQEQGIRTTTGKEK